MFTVSEPAPPRHSCLLKTPVSKAPDALADLTNSQWRGKVALAYPLFGTTTAHLLALRELWGRQAWETWCHLLIQANEFITVE